MFSKLFPVQRKLLFSNPKYLVQTSRYHVLEYFQYPFLLQKQNSRRYHNSYNKSFNNKNSWLKYGALVLGVSSVFLKLYKDYNSPIKCDSKFIPEYSKEEVAKMKSKDNGGIWVIYQENVYDVTNYIDKHPAGVKLIMLAAGGNLEPFFDAHPSHKSPEVLALLDDYRIGRLKKDKPPKQVKEFFREEVAMMKSKDDGGIWVIYQENVYDVTNYISKHPTGVKLIMLAAGGNLEPFFDAHPSHKSPEVLEILDGFRIGRLKKDIS